MREKETILKGIGTLPFNGFFVFHKREQQMVDYYVNVNRQRNGEKNLRLTLPRKSQVQLTRKEHHQLSSF